MLLRFIHDIASVDSSLFFIAEWDSIVWIQHILSTYPSVDGHLGYFQFGAAMNIHVQVFIVDMCFHFSWVHA